MDDVTAFRRAWGERIRSHRQDQGLSLRGLAERTGLHFTTIRQIENGTQETSVAVRLRIADALSVDPDALFSHAGVERPSHQEMAVA